MISSEALSGANEEDASMADSICTVFRPEPRPHSISVQIDSDQLPSPETDASSPSVEEILSLEAADTISDVKPSLKSDSPSKKKGMFNFYPLEGSYMFLPYYWRECLHHV